MKTTALLTLLAGATVAAAQPSTLPAPVPTPNVPAGTDSRGNDYLAPGPFPMSLNAGRFNIITRASGVMDGTNSNYLRFADAPVGGPYLYTAGGLNEGDFDLNVSPNADLIADFFDGGGFADPRAEWIFPTIIWDSIQNDQLSIEAGEVTYAWALTIGAGTAFLSVPENGRDNNFTDFGLPTGTLYGIGQATPNDFRGGRGYNMLTGEYGNGNGSIYMSLCAAGLPTEYIMNAAVAWFPYMEGWTTGCTTGTFPAAWSERTTAPDAMTGDDVTYPSRSPLLPEDASEVIVLQDNGFAQGTFDFTGTDLGHTPANAMLFMQGASGSNNLNLFNLVENGDTWDFLGRKDDGIDQDGTDTSEFTTIGSGDFSFVVLPLDTANLVGGSYNADGSAINTTGGATLTRTAAGTYEFAVDGENGEDGMLLLQATGAAVGDASLPGRNFMSYEYANGVYVIQSREVVLGSPGNVYGEEYPLVDTPFYVAYLSFSNPAIGPGLGGGCNAADLAEPFGTLDLADIAVFVTGFTGQDPIADLDGNNIFDLADISAFVTLFSAGCP